MPGFAMHYLFGAETFHELTDKDEKRILRNHRGAFGLGLQGPDLFFYYLPCYIHKVNIGSVMHRYESNRFFSCLLKAAEELQGEDGNTAFAYVCGFLGHYTLDRILHPYVYSRTRYNPEGGKNNAYYETHFEMETRLDIVWLQDKRGAGPQQFHAERTINVSKAEVRIISELLSAAITGAYDIKITPEMVKRAVWSMKMGTALLHDDRGKKKRLAARIQRITGNGMLYAMIAWGGAGKGESDRILNHDREPWENPWNRSDISTESVEMLYERAKREYKIVLKLMRNAAGSSERKELMERLGNRSYHSGL